MWHGADGMGWWMLWGGLMMVLFWGAVIAIAVWAVQAVTRPERGGTSAPASDRTVRTPLDVAKERYARGEIDREAFQQLRADLEDPGS